MARFKKPECFTDREWEDWNVEVLPYDRIPFPCRYCTPEFKREQMIAMKCSRPDTVFVRSVNSDGEPELIAKGSNPFATHNPAA